MNITSVTVGWQQTQSLPEYSNIKPSVIFTAQLGEEDDLAGVVFELRTMAKEFVEAQIDDALEANERPAKYSLEARYDVYVCSQLTPRLTAIVPHGSYKSKHLYRQHENFRLTAARKLARQNEGNLIEYTGGTPFIELEHVEAELTAKDEAEQLERDRRNAERQAERDRRNNPTLHTPAEEKDEDEEEDEE